MVQAFSFALGEILWYYTFFERNEKMKDGSEILHFLKPDENTILSSFSDSDLKEFLQLLNLFALEIRPSLNIDSKTTFGLEIECEDNHTDAALSDPTICNYLGAWSVEIDATLKDGYEFISPILTDSIKTWEDVQKMCEALKKYYKILDGAAGHIHIGANLLENNAAYWKKFITLWAAYEHILFRFAYGEFNGPRPALYNYARPLKEDFIIGYYYFNEPEYEDFNNVIEIFTSYRNQAINFQNIIRKGARPILNDTVEFRVPNGTLEPVVWQNNVNLFAKLLNSIKRSELDMDFVEYRLNSFINLDFSNYGKIDTKTALEFSDLIFQNNLDKIYFLKQYFKDQNNSKTSFTRCKTLIKK